MGPTPRRCEGSNGALRANALDMLFDMRMPSSFALATADIDKQPAQDHPASRRAFAATSVWIFDLDNTLYPAACDLFSQVDRRMAEYIARELGLSFADAHRLRLAYYREYGTTLAGLMRVHGLAPAPFLDFVHDIDLSRVAADARLAAALARLSGRRLIFTNGSRGHAERVAQKLGVLHLFEDICDVAACEYAPKPSREAFLRMARRHDVSPGEAAIFEDMPQNLEVPHALGMTTVLVEACEAEPAMDHRAVPGATAPPYVHHRTRDLRAFLEALPD